MRALRLAALALAAAALCLGLAGCDEDDPPAGGATRVDLVLDWFPNPDHAGIYAAIEEGFFAEEGLDVRPEVPSDPAAALKQLGAGRAPFAISYEPEVLLARSEGIPVLAVGALITHPLNGVIVREDRAIARPRDLEGKTVGATGLPMDRPLLDTVVRSDGGDPSRVRVVPVGFNLAPALAAGRVDALIGAYWNIEQVELERQGIPVAAFRVEEHGVPDYDELVVATNDATAAQRPELVRRFLRALRKGQDWAATDQAGAVDHLLAANPDLEQEAVEEQLRLTAPLLSPSEGSTLGLDLDEWRAFAAWLEREGVLERPVDVEAAVSDRFLPEEAR